MYQGEIALNEHYQTCFIIDMDDLHNDICILPIRICSVVTRNRTHALPGIHLEVYGALVCAGIGVNKVREGRNKPAHGGHVEVGHIEAVRAFVPVFAALSGDQAIGTPVYE